MVAPEEQNVYSINLKKVLRSVRSAMSVRHIALLTERFVLVCLAINILLLRSKETKVEAWRQKQVLLRSKKWLIQKQLF